MFRLFCIALLVILSVIDIVSLTVPDAAVFMLLGAAVIWIPSEDLLDSVPAAAAILGAYLLTVLVCGALKRSAPFGMGDAKLLCAISLGLGIPEMLRLFAAAGLLSGIFAAVLLLLKKAKPGSQMPFVPFIALGYALAALPGLKI